MHIVLYEPEIPQNTGNISRTCAATGAHLHLIEPMGFEVTEKQVKRAGLDYWDKLKLTIHPDFDDLLRQYPKARFFFTTTKGAKNYTEVAYGADDFLVFGPESRGLPESLLKRVYGRCIRIPMLNGIRSLNLSNAVAVILFEALRQQGFEDFQIQGSLTGRQDASAPWMTELEDSR